MPSAFPIEVQIAVYDLLPEGSLSSSLYWTGLGLYHTSIRIPELELEWNYGHSSQPVTGVFVLPMPKAGQGSLIPHIRFKKVISLGNAFPSVVDEVEEDTAHLLAGTEDREATVARILELIEGMKGEKEWQGPSYDVLRRNCNAFTEREELGFRMTGKRGPAWINRAANFAVNLPCIVPQEWIEPPTTEEEPPEAVERELDRHPERTTVG